MKNFDFNKVTENLVKSEVFNSSNELAQALDDAVFEIMAYCCGANNSDPQGTKAIIQTLKTMRDTMNNNGEASAVNEALNQYSNVDGYIQDLDNAAFCLHLYRNDSAEVTQATDDALNLFKQMRDAFKEVKE